MGGMEAAIGVLAIFNAGLAAQAQVQAVRFMAMCKAAEHLLDAMKGNWKDDDGNIPLLEDLASFQDWMG